MKLSVSAQVWFLLTTVVGLAWLCGVVSALVVGEYAQAATCAAGLASTVGVKSIQQTPETPAS